MKKEFTTNELLKIWKLVKKEKEKLDKPGANQFIKRIMKNFCINLNAILIII